ncbi:MAG: Gmad2 immunoglobulin-like domain-containing protein [bacterium]|nr:Gmad2 immunoglobulin-like domain-containing protein [bacterium]
MKKNDQGHVSVSVAILIMVFLAGVGVAFLYDWYHHFKQGKLSYEIVSPEDISPELDIEGNKDDLINFSVKPGDTVSGILNFTGSVKNAYFFEGNIGINILDENKKVLKRGNAMATTDWMTVEPVSFSGSIDLTGLPTGPGYIQIANDNPSDRRDLDKFIYIPVTIGQSQASTSTTYTYSNHGITMELPKGFIPQEEQSATGPYTTISLPTGSLSYTVDASWHEKYSIPKYTYIKDQKIGETTFKVYEYAGARYYWFKRGAVGYQFGGTDIAALENLLKTFRFVGWAE